jgi:hypothetical protein
MIDKIIRLIKVERVDDIPVLLAHLQKMQVPVLLDQFFPTHGHWKGELSFGEVVAVWLTFVASQGDHCLSHVQRLCRRPSRHAHGLCGEDHSPAGLQR